MDELRVGVIGTGHLGKLHARLYKKIKNARLIGIFDTNHESAQDVAKEHKCKHFKSLQEIIEEVDAVNIVTPTSAHFEIAKFAIQNNKHIFIEKPITSTVSQAEQLLKLSLKQQCLIQVGHIERFNSAMESLRDVELNPIFIEAHRLASFNPRGTDVAVILDLMIHDLDLILHLVKSEPVKVDASGAGVISNNVDIANARIEFENGCVANITASRISAKKMRKMRIFQKNAYISMDFLEGFSEIFYLPQENQASFQDSTLAFSLGEIDAGDQKREIKYSKLKRKKINPLQNELQSFVDSILKNQDPLVSAEDGIRALKLANKVLQKISEHQSRVI